MNWNYTSKQLQRLRSDAGLTQREVTDMLGLKDTANISDWENDRVDVPPKHREKLINIYRVVTKIQGNKAFKDTRKFTFAEMLAARFWFMSNNIKNEAMADRIGISAARLQEILESEEYSEAVEGLIISARTPRKLREWIDTCSPSGLAIRMQLPKTVVSEMLERIKRNIEKEIL